LLRFEDGTGRPKTRRDRIGVEQDAPAATGNNPKSGLTAGLGHFV
jgi:hypothetical protein